MDQPLDLDAHLPGIAAGDAAAFARWMVVAEPTVRASLRGFAARVDVEAVVQEALLRAWQAAPRVASDGRPNGLLRLTLRAARHLAIDDARRAHHRDTSLDADDAPAPMDPAALVHPDPLLRRVIAACLGRLPERPAAALRARLEAAGAEADAALAARCGMVINTFLQNVGRARKHLLACLAEHGAALDLATFLGGAG